MYKNADHFSHNNASCTSSSYLSGDTCVILYQLGQITWKTINKEGKKQLAGWIKITLSQNLPGVWLQINLTDCRTRTHTDTHTQHPAVLALLMLCVCVCVCVLGVSLCDLFIPATDCRCICIQTLCVFTDYTAFVFVCVRGCRTLVGASEGLSGLQAGVDASEVSEQRAHLLLPALLLLVRAARRANTRPINPNNNYTETESNSQKI